ncbi:AAA family ATPase [Ruminococcus flavefaciens]|uniref:AAA family ATPase n=1 Tax=Ruminococcus flavefaciens TaxID=1265 RepID=UPI0026E998B0|nr:SMC family ATPase [Ruminococcus flavefaciens]MDD7516604.1 SMC family ATPase [Ruminococcus flavefaciens]MDY5690394.1 SMC family ATPase [Ruminococcus flavefaciens]
MRPIRLEISGFGPYSGKTVLELETLGNKGLYLITGDTGAGKTTIFDAVTYALYGSASGANRDDDSMLRSKYATLDTPTYVKLEFEYNGKRYSVKRNPEYTRRAKRGDGEAKEPANAIFVYPDGKAVSGKRDVDAAVDEVIGLTEKQFKQIAMIAQGDFMKLITEDTGQRREILRHIFKTANYQTLQETLKQESSALKSACDSHRGSIGQYVSGIVCGEDDEYADEVAKLKEEIPPVEYITEVVEKLIARDKARAEVFSHESEALDEKLAAVNGRISKAEEKAKTAAEHEKASQTLSEIQHRRKLLAEELEKEEARKPELEKAMAEFTRIEAEMPEYSKISELMTQSADTEKAIAENIEQLAKLAASKDGAEKKLAQLKAELLSLDDAGEKTAILNSEREKLEKRAYELAGLAKMVRECEKSAAELKSAAAELKEEQSEHDSLLEKSEKLSEELIKQKKRRAEIENCGEEREKLLREENNLIIRRDELKKLSDSIKEWKKYKNEHIKAAAAYKEAADTAELLAREYDRGYRAFLDDQAGVLAAGLQNGKPCPVCGSREHPCPAASHGKAPSESELEELKTRADSARADAEERSTAASAVKGKAEELERALVSRTDDLLGCGTDKAEERCEAELRNCTDERNELDKKLAEAGSLIAERDKLTQDIASKEKQAAGILTAIAAADKKLAELRGIRDRIDGAAKQMRSDTEKKAAEILGEQSFEKILGSIADEKKLLDDQLEQNSLQLENEEKKLKHKKEVENLIPKGEQYISEKTEKMTEITAAKAASESRLSELSNSLAELRERLHFESREKASEYAESLRKHVNELKKAYESAEQAMRDVEKQCSAEAGKLKQLTAQLDSFGDIDGAAEMAKRSRLTDERTQLTEKLRKLHIQLTVNRTAIENIKSGSAELTELESRYQLVKNLSDTANGKLSAQNKFMLETYIQTSYFDRIIERANERLKVMSEGQYTLVRRREYEDKRAQVGLDLDVIDHYNGSVRSVKTLSGGESFKASLSLALGLSDEIQCSAGGIKLDTMFVDEGFGSLDDNSIEQAMRALSILSEGNRLVGIISHVQALKQRIDKQIVVRKDKDGGSRAEMLV